MSGPDSVCGALSRTDDLIMRVMQAEFVEMAETSEKRQDWFVARETEAYANRGLAPSASQCTGFRVPEALSASCNRRGW